jgi:hypothetical protein
LSPRLSRPKLAQSKGGFDRLPAPQGPNRTTPPVFTKSRMGYLRNPVCHIKLLDAKSDVKEVAKRLFLIKGPLWHRAYLVVFYILLFDYLVVFSTFFSLAPGPASVMSDRMDRALMVPALTLLPLNVIALLLWLIAGVRALVKSIRGSAKELWGLGYAVFPILGYLILSTVYDAFLRGHGRSIHNFFYHLPEKL